jgi:peptide-methionine (S)-S-oxide reductase
MTTERAVLAGGCFWGMQDLIRKLPGVISTRVGYTGGNVKNATYRNHEGHAEAIEIIFDPTKTDFRTLLEFFFQIHDPSTLNRQGNDLGTSYRSAIFYTNDEQKKVAEDTIADVDASHFGPARWLPRSRPSAISGRPSLSTRIISSATRTATPATFRVRVGSCRSGWLARSDFYRPGLRRSGLSASAIRTSSA